MNVEKRIEKIEKRQRKLLRILLRLVQWREDMLAEAERLEKR